MARGTAGRFGLLVPLAFLMAAALAVWWSVRASMVDQGAGAEPGSSAIGMTAYPAGERQRLPEISGTTITGTSLDLDSLRGRVLVINVWGSWCAPCRDEAPDLAQVSAETRSSGVRFVGIDVRDDPADARAFVGRYGITYPSLADRDGKILASLVGLVPIGAVPSTMVVDRAGGVAARVIGRVDAATLRAAVSRVLDEPALPASTAGP